MNLMLREKKQSRNSALKVIFFNITVAWLQVLDHAVAGPEGKDNCNKFVEILGTVIHCILSTVNFRLENVISSFLENSCSNEK